jgi:hypothetical protein
MTATVDGNPYTLVIGANRRAQLTVVSSPGPHDVALTDPGTCFNPIAVTCDGLLAREEEDGGERAGMMSVEESGEVSLVEELPQVTALLGNYPNPFNPRTTISFNLVTEELVELRIYDILGREVATLINEILPAGTHSRQWDGSDQASGMYFYHFRVGEVSETRKLLLMK